MAENRPKGREVNHVGGSGSVNRRGSGLGTGPVGKNGTYGRSSGSGYTGGSSSSHATGQGHGTSGGGFGGGKIGLIIVIIIAIIFGKKFLGGNSGSSTNVGSVVQTASSLFGGSSSGSASTVINLLSNLNYSTSEDDYSAYNFNSSQSTEGLNTSVASGARSKYTDIKGRGKDEVTIMVYMCGTDLESKSGMATADLQEMCNAKLSDKINLIVETGGCKGWKTKGISNSVNQIYQIKKGKLVSLDDNFNSLAMTDSSNLTDFINYCSQSFPADRYELIMWDHGGGSISGFGYDERESSSSMNLTKIDAALRNTSTKFDFIGFDACLMATLENALMLTDYADYMIASEETEPGVGWYYTNWLNEFSDNTSIETTKLGKIIIDDYTDVCARKTNNSKTTLSIVDLAELQCTVPSEFRNFAVSTSDMIENNDYAVVSSARNNAREFAQSSKIDQIDLVHFAKNLNTREGSDLANALLGAIKYNRTSSNIKNAYGLSIYFPYKKASKVSSMVSTYNQIGIDTEYSKCIQNFASLEMSGQVSSSTDYTGQSTYNSPSMFDSFANFSFPDFSEGSITGVLSEVLGGGEGFGGILSDLFKNSSITSDKAAEYISKNHFDASKLVWTQNANNENVIAIPESQWELVESVDLSVFYDDGTGYIDLGLDNVLNYDDKGNLIGSYDGSWLAINGQVVSYYHTDSTESEDGSYSYSGYIPVMLNGTRAELLVSFTNEYPNGTINGARFVYTGESDTVAKDLVALTTGDKIDFICDYYTYDGEYKDTYYIGQTMQLGDTIEIGNIAIDSTKAKPAYKFTDIYQQQYWTPEFH